MSELPAVYEDEMDERYAVQTEDEYERQHHRELHDERKALFVAAVGTVLPDFVWAQREQPNDQT